MEPSIKTITEKIVSSGSKCSWEIINEMDQSKPDTLCMLTDDARRLLEEKTTNQSNTKSTNPEIQSMNREEVVQQIKKIVNTNSDHNCGEDLSCMVKTNDMIRSEYKRLIDNGIRPPKPRHSSGWLSSSDIFMTMKSLVRLYDNYRFMGPIARDWENYGNELTLFDISDDISKGLTRFGIIFNTDVHTGPGIHWVSVFIDTVGNIHSKCSIEFYNSFGVNPPNEINRFLLKIKKELEQIGRNCVIRINHTKHQRENRECGIFAMNYIFLRLDNNSVDSIYNSRKINDTAMKHYRPVIFTEGDSPTDKGEIIET